MKLKTKRLLAKLLLAGIAFLVCLLFIEGVLQVIHGNRVAYYAVSPGGGKTYEIINEEFIHMVHTNKMNIRDEEMGEKQEDEYRILFAGDSFTFALGVDFEDAFHTRMEKQLTFDGKRVNALNLGGKREVFWKTRDNIKEVQADAMVVQIFIGNDFYDLQTETHLSFEDSGTENPTATQGPLQPASTTGQAQLKPTPKKPGKQAKKSRGKLKIHTLDILWRNLIRIEAFDNYMFKTNRRYGGRAILLREYPELEKRLVERELEILAHMHDAAKALDVDFYAFIIPFRVQSLKAGLLDKDKYDYQKPNRILRDFFKERDIPCLDFLQIYDQMEPKTVKSFYYRKDMHWTAGGHRHAAETLTRFLCETNKQFKPTSGN